MYYRGKVLYERFKFPDGSEKRICLDTGDKDLALKVKAKIETDILMDKHFGQKRCQKKVNVRTMLNKCLDLKESSLSADTFRQEKYWLKSIISKFGDVMLDAVTPVMLDEFIGELRKSGLKDGTIGDRLKAFKRSFELARVKYKMTENDPFSMVKIPSNKQHRVRYLTDEERAILLEALSQSKYLWLRDYVVVACETGFRRRNMVEMTWKHVDFKSCTITFSSSETKNKKPLMMPMSQNVLNVITSIYNRDKKGYVFKNRIGKPINREGLTNQFTKLTKKFGIPDFHIHDMRHDFCSQLALGGAELYDICDMAGHSNLEQTMRYTHLMPKRKRKAIEIFNSVPSANKLRAIK